MSTAPYRRSQSVTYRPLQCQCNILRCIANCDTASRIAFRRWKACVSPFDQSAITGIISADRLNRHAAPYCGPGFLNPGERSSATTAPTGLLSLLFLFPKDYMESPFARLAIRPLLSPAPSEVLLYVGDAIDR